MSSGSGQSVPLWRSSNEQLHPLRGDTETGVCVVGAGIAGLSVAYFLIQEGRDVLVLDSGHIGGGETMRTTAHLASALDDGFAHLETLFGEQGAHLAAESHRKAIDEIERIAKHEHIDCDFTRCDGYLFVPPKQSREILEKELPAARRAGMDVTEVERAPLPGFDTGPCLRFRNQGQFHPMRYLAGLAKAITAKGGIIATGTQVTSIDEGSTPILKTSDGHTVRAKAVVIATNAPIADNAAIYGRQAAYRTYVIAAAIPKGSVPLALYWDTQEAYHYVRVEQGEKEDLLIVGGEDHKTGQSDDGEARFRHLEEWTRARFPQMNEIRYRWSGQVMEPADSLALIGKKPLTDAPISIATGDSGHGMTHGTIAGILLTDLLQGRQNPWTDLYNPSRVPPLKATTELAKENANVAKELVANWLKRSEVQSPEDIRPGEGVVMRKGLTKIALYRDPQGSIHTCSAVCPHKGCIVQWNGLEKSWDCPCHGSRFDTEGHVLNGPTSEGLKLVEIEEPISLKLS